MGMPEILKKVQQAAEKMIDSHCHLEQKDYDKDRDELILKCKKELKAIITSCAHPDDFEKTLKIVEKNKGFVFCTVGIHPEYIEKISEREIDAFIEKVRKNSDKIVGIGEVGLDYHYIKELELQDRQRNMFIKLLKLAKELDKPVVIHSREALPETLEILEKENMKHVLLHMWGGHSLMDKVIELGYYVSMNSIIVGSKSYGKVVKKTPLDRLMLETDAPWMAVRREGDSYVLDSNSRNDSLTIKITSQKIAEIKNLDTDTVWKACGTNSIRFFNLPLNI